MPKKHHKNELVASDTDASIEAQVAEILQKHGNASSEWLLLTQQQIFPCEANVHTCRESLVDDMANALTCHCFIVAIYHQSRRLTDDEIAPLRAEALDGLRPISRARADGLL